MMHVLETPNPGMLEAVVSDGPSGSLAQEALIFARYLIGRQPSAALIARYVDAERIIGNRAPSLFEIQLVKFALARPWSVGCLDSACALLRPHSLLREKILRLAAILEASPECALDFLPAARGMPATLVCLFSTGLSSIAQLVAGATLLKMLELRTGAVEGGR